MVVRGSAVQITTSGPADQVAENGKAVFTVAVEGENLTYKWQYQRADGTKWFYTTMEGYATNTPRFRQSHC